MRLLPLAPLLALAVTACSGGESIPVTDWTLDEPGGARRAVTLPVHLDLPDEPTTYTLRTRVEVPAPWRGRPLTLAIPSLLAPAALRVGGRALEPEDTSDSERYRAAGPHRWRIPASLTGDALELALVVEHRWARSAWLDTVPRLGTSLRGDPGYRIVFAWNFATAASALGVMLLLAFLYMISWLVDRSRTSHGWTALQAFGVAFYPLHALGWSQPIFGTHDTAVCAIALAAGVLASVHFTRSHFRVGRTPRSVWLAVGALVLLALVAPGPFRSVRLLTPATLLVVLAVIVYQTIEVTRLIRRRVQGAVVILASWIMLGLTAWTDFVGWIGLGEPLGGLHGTGLGIVLAGLCQGLLLGLDHVRSLRRADGLILELQGQLAELERTNREVRVLNDELRRQIADRSQDLARRLARLERDPSAMPALAPDEQIDGRYRVVRQLGAGATGAVYEVRRLADDRRFALKLLVARRGQFAMARFAREAEIAARLDHPNLVSIVDIDVSQSGALYLVMELVDGPSLEASRSRFGDTTFALPILAQLSEGLRAIHEAGIVHRDLKPANVLVATRTDGAPLIKIADFGIATLHAAAADPEAPAGDPPHTITHERLTHTGVILGTPLYMAPELADGAPTAPEQDLFSFGVIAHEILTGELPFPAAPVRDRAQGKPVAPFELRRAPPGVSEEVLALIGRCLALDPSRRPTAGDLARALTRF